MISGARKTNICLLFVLVYYEALACLAAARYFDRSFMFQHCISLSYEYWSAFKVNRSEQPYAKTETNLKQGFNVN